MVKIRKVISIIAASIMILSLSSCTSKTGGSTPSPTEAPAAPAQKTEEKVKLKIYAQYSSPDEKQPYDYAVAEMKKIMPNVELELDIMAQDDDQKIKTYAASGNLPDIFVVNSNLIDLFKKSNKLLELDSYVKELKIEDRLVQSSAQQLWSDDKHCYAIPNVGPWAAVLFINKGLFESNGVKIPGNYEELLAAVKAFKSKNVLPLTLFAKEKWPGVQLLDMLATRMEPEGLSKIDGGKAKISDEAYKVAAERLVELVKAGLISPSAFNTTYDQACSLFTEGKAAMFMCGAWMMGEAGKKLGDKVDILYSVPFAEASKAEATKWNMSGGGLNQAYAVSANSKNKEVAAKYACEFALKFAEGRVIKCGDPNPILKNSAKPEAGYNAVQQKYVNESPNFKSMTCFPWGFKDPKFKVAIEDNTQKLLTGQYSVTKFIEDVNKALENK